MGFTIPCAGPNQIRSIAATELTRLLEESAPFCESSLMTPKVETSPEEIALLSKELNAFREQRLFFTYSEVMIMMCNHMELYADNILSYGNLEIDEIYDEFHTSYISEDQEEDEYDDYDDYFEDDDNEEDDATHVERHAKHFLNMLVSTSETDRIQDMFLEVITIRGMKP